MVVIVAPSVVSYPKDMFGNFSKKLRFRSQNFFMNIESNLKLFIDFIYINNTNTFHTIPVSQHIDEKRRVAFWWPCIYIFCIFMFPFQFWFRINRKRFATLEKQIFRLRTSSSKTAAATTIAATTAAGAAKGVMHKLRWHNFGQFWPLLSLLFANVDIWWKHPPFVEVDTKHLNVSEICHLWYFELQIYIQLGN